MVRSLFQFLLCEILVILLMIVVPTSYYIKIRLILKGDTSNVNSLSESIERSWIQGLGKQPSVARALSKLKCEDTFLPLEVTCDIVVSKRSLTHVVRNKLERFIDYLGWVTPEALEGRIEQLNIDMTRQNEKLANLEKDLLGLAPSDSSQKHTYEVLTKRIGNLSQELNNTIKQKLMIEEALPMQTEPIRSQFLEKSQKLAKKIEDLEMDLRMTKLEFKNLGVSYDRQETIQQDILATQTSIDEAVSRLTKLSTVLAQHHDQKAIPDPEHFQIAMLKDFSTTEQHNFGHLPWSLILGVFFYGFLFHPIRRTLKTSEKNESRVFNPEMLQDILRCPYLGKIDLAELRNQQNNNIEKPETTE